MYFWSWKCFHIKRLVFLLLGLNFIRFVPCSTFYIYNAGDLLSTSEDVEPALL